MEIAVGEKFAAYFLRDCDVEGAITETGVEVASGVFVASRFSGANLAGHWEKWLGTLAMEDFARPGLLLYAQAASREPGVLDAENEELKVRIERIYQSMLLQSVPWYGKGYSLTGANLDGEAEIRQIGNLVTISPTAGIRPPPITLAEVRSATELATRMEFLRSKGNLDEWARLRRAIRALLIGTTVDNSAGDRLHQFVRALEGLTRPREARSTADFAHRCRTFATVQTGDETLRQLYELRSRVEHLHEASVILPGATEQDRFALADRRTRQADRLARFAFTRILTSDDLFARYKNDADIDAFWRLQDHERQKIFGATVDISAIQ